MQPIRITGTIRAGYPYIIIIFLLFLSYLPYLTYNFGFHNDFEIWNTENKVCCSWFSEFWHLTRVGRVLQAILQSIYLANFTDLQSLVVGRGLGIAFAAIGAILISIISRKHGMDKFTSIAFGAGVFLLPPAQINLGWVTNFIPGIFNAALVLFAALLFPAWISLRKYRWRAFLLLTICFVLLLASLFIYPPTAGFFLLPITIGIIYKGLRKEEIVQTFFTLTFYGLACVTYFVFHRYIFMKYYKIEFAADSFYRFDLASSVIENLTVFIKEICFVMLNLWNTVPSILVAGVVSAIIVISLIHGAKRRPFESGQRSDSIWYTILVGEALLVIFLVMNLPGLIPVGGPPNFYRAWHPGMAMVLLLFLRGSDFHLFVPFKKLIISILLLVGAFFAFNSSHHIASTLSRQFIYATEQVKNQFFENRSRYFIVEYRPDAFFFGKKRWGEFGFIHVLTSSHVNYITSEYLGKTARSGVDNLVIKYNENYLFLDPALIDKTTKETEYKNLIKSPENIPGVTVELVGLATASIPSQNEFGLMMALDNLYYTFWEIEALDPVYADLRFYKEKVIRCYLIEAGIDKAGDRMPHAWRLWGSQDGNEWFLLDTRTDEANWSDKSRRIYKIPNTSPYNIYSFEFLETNGHKILRIYGLALSEYDDCSK